MLLLSFLVLYFLLILLYLKIFKNDSLLKLIPLFHFGVLVTSSLISKFFEEGVMPGFPDQIGYLRYGEDCSWSYYDLEIFKVFSDEIRKRAGHHPFYWALSCLVHSSSIFPIETLRLINFIVLLLLGLTFYRTQILITNNHTRSLLNTRIFLFMPSFLSFAVYTIRDLFITLFWSLCFYSILKIYSRKTFFNKHLIYLSVWIILLYLTREQAAFAMLNILFFSLIYKYLKNVKLMFFIFFILFGAIYFIPSNESRINILKSIINNIITDKDFLIKILYKLPLYFLSLGFLDPTTGKTFSFSHLLISKFFIPDTIIIPFLFLLNFKKIIHNQYRGVIFAILFAFILYFLIYMYAESYWTGGYGFHFRAYIIFFYSYTAFTLPYLRILKKNTMQDTD